MPDGLRPCLEQAPEPAQAFGIEVFLRRIADPQREYAPGKEISDTVAQLPPDLIPLLS